MNIFDTKMTAIADEVRRLTGTEGSMSLDNMANGLSSVEAGGGAPILQDKTVTPTTNQQTITADVGYDGLNTVTVNAISTTTQATPIVSVNTSTGLITATATQTAGYVTAGTKSATQQLAFQAAKTITPTTTTQTAVPAGYYTGGDIVVAGDANLTADNIKSGTSIFGVTGSYAGSSPSLQSKSVTYTSNGTATVTPDEGYDGLSSVDVTVNVSGGGGGSGAGFKVTFPATASGWSGVDPGAAHIFLADGTYKSIKNYSTIGGKTIKNVTGISIRSYILSDVLRMTLSAGGIAQINSETRDATSYVVTTAPNSTATPYNQGRYLFWWPIADTVISAIEMYIVD